MPIHSFSLKLQVLNFECKTHPDERKNALLFWLNNINCLQIQRDTIKPTKIETR